MYVRRMAGENYEKFWDNGMYTLYWGGSFKKNVEERLNGEAYID